MFRSGCDQEIRRADAVPGACATLAEWIFAHAPDEHRSLLVEIDEEGKKGLASPAVLILLFFLVAL